MLDPKAPGSRCATRPQSPRRPKFNAADTLTMPLILIADDSPEIRGCAALALSNRGYKVLLAEDGRRALEILRSEAVDLVLTDLVMPECEGIELIIAVRARFPRLPMIAMSGARERVAYLRSAVHLGAMRTIEKPFDVATLLSTVEAVLRPAAGDTAARHPPLAGSA